MAEWSIAAVLKTVEGHTSGGSNPSLSAKTLKTPAEAGVFNVLNHGDSGLRRDPRRGFVIAEGAFGA